MKICLTFSFELEASFSALHFFFLAFAYEGGNITGLWTLGFHTFQITPAKRDRKYRHSKNVHSVCYSILKT